MFAVKLMKKRGVSTKTRGGAAVGRLRRDVMAGQGVQQSHYEKIHESPSLGVPANSRLEGLRVKTSRPKKYISLNF